MKNSSFRIASYGIALISLVIIFVFHLTPAVLAGMLMYLLTSSIASKIAPSFLKANRREESGYTYCRKSAMLSLVVVLLGVALMIFGGYLAVDKMISAEGASLTNIWLKMADILADLNQLLPAWVSANFPEGADAVKAFCVDSLRNHAAEIKGVGKEALVFLMHTLLGGILGVMIAIDQAPSDQNALIYRQSSVSPFSVFADRLSQWSATFSSVITAQVKIAAINAAATGFYLLVILPLCGQQIPFAKTLVLLTFAVGLLPVAGNLISNTIIVVLSLSVSLSVTMASLLFLVALHKVEYFLNAKIIGAQIHAKVYELLLAMLVMESLFGVEGVVMAPIVYAYLKREVSLFIASMDSST